MTVNPSWLRGDSSSDRNRIGAPRASSREGIAGIGAGPAFGLRNARARCRGLWKLPQPWKWIRVGLRPASDRSIPTAACKSLRNKRSGFRPVTHRPGGGTIILDNDPVRKPLDSGGNN